MLDRTDHSKLAAMAAARLSIGGNNPPSLLDLAKDAISNIGAFLKDHPVIQTEDDARKAKLEHDRAAAMVKDLEDERDRQVRPLNEQVSAINGRYRPIRDPLEKIIKELKNRMSVFARAEEAKREAIAKAARDEAERLEQLARDAEAEEQNAIAEAALGVLDVDVAGATVQADEVFSDFRHAARTASRAEREAHVRIGGGLGRISSLRNKEVLTVTDACAAIAEMGLTDLIRDAILTSARAYRKEFGELPDGIIATQERSI